MNDCGSLGNMIIVINNHYNNDALLLPSGFLNIGGFISF